LNNYFNYGRKFFLCLFFGGFIFAETSTAITQSVVYPRINFQNNEDVLSRTQIRFSQSFFSLGELKLNLAYITPALSPWENLQVYNFSFKTIKKHNLQFEFGRIVNWNNNYTARVDGLRANIYTTLGKITYTGGYKTPDLYNNDDSFQTNVHFIEWKINKKNNALALNSWMINQRTSQDLFMGLSLRKRLLGNINSNLYAVWDFSNEKLQKLRFRISKNLTLKHMLFLDIRSRSYSGADPYPWSTKKIESHSSVTLGHKFSLKPGLQWSNSIGSVRGGAESDFRYRSSLQARNMSFSFSAEEHNKSNSLGGSINARKALSKRIYMGSSLFYRSYSFNEDYDTFNTTGASAWLNFQINSHLHFRITGNIYQNRYFNQDGRGGIIINYVP